MPFINNYINTSVVRMNKLRLLRKYFLFREVFMKTYKKHFDIGFRDGPVLFVLGKLYIGSYIYIHIQPY